MPPTCLNRELGSRARDYVLGRLAEPRAIEFEDHLAGCAACAEKVNAFSASLTRLERAVREEPTGFRWWIARPAFSAALAAGVVVALLGYPTFLGLHRLPQLESDVEMLRRTEAESRELQARAEARILELQASPPGGLVDVNFLPQTTRGEQDQVSFRIPPDQPVVYLAFVTDPRTITHPSRTCRIEVVCQGDAAWSSTLDGADVKRQLESAFGAVVVAVPSAALPAGTCEMRVTEGDQAGGAILFRRDFQISR